MKKLSKLNCRKRLSQLWFCRTIIKVSFLLLLGIIPLTSFAQGLKNVSGIILDAETGDPIIGATVVVANTTNGTITDIDGKYNLQVSGDVSLTFSYIGYVSQTIPVGVNSEINVKMVSDLAELGEVVVIAYGTTTSKNFTGSTTRIKTADSPLAEIPATDAMSVLKGTVPGMTVSQEQGAGQSSSLLVRGQKSINTDAINPLIVLDGIIFMGNMRDIDPSSIESISVLKDATSVAAYGSRAANGVIMITSKKGIKGKPVITFNSSVGVSSVINKADVLSPDKWIEKVNLLQGLDANADPTSWMSDFEDENYANNKTIDWQDYSERAGSNQNYNLSVSGANEKMNYYFSGSHTKTKGVMIGDDYERTAFTTRLKGDITDWLEVGTNVNFSFNDYSGPSVYDIYQAIRLTPYGRAYRDEENKLLEKFPATEGIYRTNPLWNIKSGTIDDHDVYYTTVLSGHAVVKVPWIKGLKYRTNYSYTIKNVERDYFTHEGNYVAEGTSDDRYSASAVSDYLAKANGYSARTNDLAYVWDNILTYTTDFGLHHLDLTAVYTRDSYDYKYKKVTGTDFSALGNTTLSYNGLTYAATQKIDEITNTEKTNIGYLGRASYNYNHKYHLTASVRRDGASVFGKEDKWGVFPAIGAGWTISSENFMSNVSSVDYLKLKVSWGINGNQSLDPYQTLSTIKLGQSGDYSYSFGNDSEVDWGQRVSVLGNTTLGWEETTSLNAGFELTMFDSKLNLDVDGYVSKTKNQIFERNIPVMANGITTMDETMGQINNWGLEVTLNTTNFKRGDWEWNSTLTYYINRNKLKELYGDGEDDISNSLFLNQSLGAIYGYKQIGIVQESDTEYINANGAQAGDVMFYDKDGSGEITSDDRTILGFSKENFRMSFANTVSYKDFQLYALFNGVFGGGDYYKQANIYAYRTASDVPYDNNLNHGWWTAENQSNKYPRVNYTDGRYTPVQSRGFVRLQNLNLSYRFKQDWVKDLKIDNLKVFFAATNLFTITNWEGGDPETGQTLGSGYSYGYPLSSTYSIGVDLKF